MFDFLILIIVLRLSIALFFLSLKILSFHVCCLLLVMFFPPFTFDKKNNRNWDYPFLLNFYEFFVDRCDVSFILLTIWHETRFCLICFFVDISMLGGTWLLVYSMELDALVDIVTFLMLRITNKKITWRASS